MRTAVSSAAAAAALALFALIRLAGGLAAARDSDFATARDARAVGAGAAFAVPATVRFLPAGDAPDTDLAEEADLAFVTLPVGSSEPLPTALFPLVVFAIANLASVLRKQTAENLVL
ncbi:MULTISPECIES: RNA polymerase subunit sigma [Burkholderia]|uniref:RNA polymerase subunit sigma n=1 Tax=Burkholderia perseverans TaxID=2615214 RepID=UPI001D04EBC2|nr:MULTISPECIES: RNA polymerase subunit sigma [Burkholderia]